MPTTTKDTERTAMEAALCSALALSPNQVFNAANPGTIPCPLSNYVPFLFFNIGVAFKTVYLLTFHSVILMNMLY